MQRLDITSPTFEKEFDRYLDRGKSLELSVERQVMAMIKHIQSTGDKGVVEYNQTFHGYALQAEGMLVSRQHLSSAWDSLGPSLKNALELSYERISVFSRREIDSGFRMVDETGMQMERRIVPLRRVGIHVSGGRGAYPLALLMGVIPAKVAGVSQVIACCPVNINNPESTVILAAAHLCGVDEFYRVGGVQAITAMAFGTTNIPKVDLIAGWGNVYEATAKKLLMGWVGINSYAGPSELCIIADGTTDPEVIACDLIAQAEHTAHARCCLICTDREVADAVELLVRKSLPGFDRGDIAGKALSANGALIVVENTKQALELSERFAPEHLIIMTEDADDLAEKVRFAGAVFVGKMTPEALGDYVAGPNHTLPTGGAARYASPLSTQTFCRAMNVMRASRGALSTLGPTSIRLAELEGLSAHAEAVRLRLKKLEGQ